MGGLSPEHVGLSTLEAIGQGGARRIISFSFGFVSRTYREAGGCGLCYLPFVLTDLLSALSPGMISAATQKHTRSDAQAQARISSESGVQPLHMLPLVRLPLLHEFPGPSVVTCSCCRSRAIYSRARLVWTKLLDLIRVAHSTNTRPVLRFTNLFKWPAHSSYSRCTPQRQLSLMSFYAWDWAPPRSSLTSPGMK